MTGLGRVFLISRCRTKKARTSICTFLENGTHCENGLCLMRSSWTNRIIAAKDHASVQIDVARVNEEGLFTGESDTFALAGYIRGQGEADMALTELIRRSDEE